MNTKLFAMLLSSTLLAAPAFARKPVAQTQKIEEVKTAETKPAPVESKGEIKAKSKSRVARKNVKKMETKAETATPSASPAPSAAPVK